MRPHNWHKRQFPALHLFADFVGRLLHAIASKAIASNFNLPSSIRRDLRADKFYFPDLVAPDRRNQI